MMRDQPLSITAIMTEFIEKRSNRVLVRALLEAMLPTDMTGFRVSA